MRKPRSKTIKTIRNIQISKDAIPTNSPLFLENLSQKLKKLKEVLCSNINNLAEIRKYGFPYLCIEEEKLFKRFVTLVGYDEKLALKSAEGSDDVCLKLNTHFSILASQFFPHMCHIRVRGSGPSIYEAWLDDKMLLEALQKCLFRTVCVSPSLLRTQLRITTAVSGVCNFRPDAAKYVYNTYSANSSGRVFDFSMGYGGRLVGFLASDCSEYVGVDVDERNFAGYDYINKLYNKSGGKKCTFIQECSENFCPPEYEGYFDICFSSPPYYLKEEYSDDANQSANKYIGYINWLDNYLEKTILNSIQMLKPGGYFIINIADILIFRKSFPLAVDTEIICNGLSDRLEYATTIYYLVATRQEHYCQRNYELTSGRVGNRAEPILIYRKK